MPRRQKTSFRNSAPAIQQLPTFEQYLRQTLDKLFSALKSEDFSISCSALAELADNLNYVDMFDLVVHLDENTAIHADAMRLADIHSWAWYLSSLGTALSRVGRFEDAITKTNEMLALGESLCDEEMQSTAIQNLGVINYSAGNVDEARCFYTRALEIKERIGDQRGQAQILNNLASMAIEDGDLDKAEILLERSFAIKKRSRDKEDILPAYGTSGNLAVARADYREARRCFSKALRIAEAINSAEDVALSYLNLGNVTMELGKEEKALSHYHAGLQIAESRRLVHAEELLRQALAVGYNRLGLYHEAQDAFQRLAGIKRRLRKGFDEAMAYHDAAVVSVQSGDSEAALDYYDKATKGFRRADNAEWEARSLWENASTLVRAGRNDEASRAVRRAVRVLHRSGCNEILPEAYAAGVHVLFQAGLVDRAVALFKDESLFLEEHGDAAYRARRLAEVGNRLLDCERPRRAVPFLQQAVSVYHDIPDPTLEALTRSDLAMAQAELGHVDQARSDYACLLAQADRDDNRVLRLLSLMNLAEVERRSGDSLTAIELGLRSVDLAEQINDTDSLAMILNNLGLAYEDVGETGKARSRFRKSLKYAKRYQDKQAQARALISLGNLDLVKSRYEEALGFYQQARIVTECVVSALSLDALESCLMCLISLERDDEASKTAEQAVEIADKIGDFERAEDIARRVALASLKRGELEDCAEALLTSLNYAAKRSVTAAAHNIATWALLLRDAEHEAHGRDALYRAITDTLDRLAPDHAHAIREMLDVAINVVNEQRDIVGRDTSQ